MDKATNEIMAGDTPQPDDLEAQWAVRAFKHADTYWSLISRFDASKLKLTKMDDEIYERFRKDFPDLDVGVVIEDQLKSDEGKAKWRPFLMAFEKELADFNMLTLLRIDASKPYDENNTTVVPRAQFYCIEIARNREGHNSSLQTPTNQAQPGFR
eukprot:Rmarinus@m.25895